MIKINELYFWEPCISPHKLDLINQIKIDNQHIKIYVISPLELPNDKSIFINDYIFEKNIEIVITQNKEKIHNLIKNQDLKSRNIISGYWGNLNAKKIIKYLSIYKKKFFYISETRFNYRIFDVIKYFQSIFFENTIRKNVDKIFCIGENSFNWFAYTFYQKKKLIKFAYYVNSYKKGIDYLDKNVRSGSHLRIGYLGALVKEKGIFNYIKALKNLKFDYEFIVSGDGEDKQKFLESCLKNNINIKYTGITDYYDKNSFFDNIDCLLLSPLKKSKRNGWCVVINESLLYGKPVICNKYIGANCIIQKKYFGTILDNDNFDSIENELINFNNNIQYYIAKKKLIIKEAQDIISINAGSKKMMHYLNDE